MSWSTRRSGWNAITSPPRPSRGAGSCLNTAELTLKEPWRTQRHHQHHAPGLADHGPSMSATARAPASRWTAGSSARGWPATRGVSGSICGRWRGRTGTPHGIRRPGPCRRGAPRHDHGGQARGLRPKRIGPEHCCRGGHEMAQARGRTFRLAKTSEFVSGTLVSSTNLASGRYAMIDDGAGVQPGALVAGPQPAHQPAHHRRRAGRRRHRMGFQQEAWAGL
jgi:hypothetical protein